MSLPKPNNKLIAEAMKLSISSWEKRLGVVEECVGLSVYTTHDWSYMIGLQRLPIGSEGCPLCILFHLYYPPMSERFCDLCPVKLLSGEKECRNTPYIKVLKKLWEYAKEDKTVDQELIDTIALQVKFLRKAHDNWMDKYGTE